ncbi:bifunctional metallophosphatase/5'-nucleotidase [Pararhodobacter zhoushanensis]|uniref:Bifunctional metallophosphatase/5'-nucleotidase n=1 Tax=Pararhodobacter zhoushanensis TaxID=2479545 RepID=A0ABT3H495_9RHOB|nr:bifunctional metallophosphatase/5'-nucleotidase [Pararhodobacter zhoushanensis]MCW1934640.1 bifunctional metallophosphatase/5'-nucleotidase [Pararhodobacter zhoushanensis]
MSFKTQFRAILGSTALAAASALPGYATELHILHFNDFHSRVEPINRFNSTCSAGDEAEGKCFGGAARLFTLINQMRDAITAEGNPVLVLSAGDESQGSLYFTTYGGAVEAEMNLRIGLDAMAVGNHEFDNGPEGLLVFADQDQYPIVAANIDVSQNNLLAGRIVPWAILETGGLRVGIVGALTEDTPDIASPGPTIAFSSAVESVARSVEELHAEGVTTIIALTHVGYVGEQRIAAEVPGLTAVVGGHSHTYLSASDPRREGPYPTWVDNVDGSIVPVVQAGAYSRYLGHLILDLDDEGKLIYATGDTIEINAEVTPDPEIAAWVATLAGPIEETRSELVSEAVEAIDGDRTTCRAMECTMGNLVTDAMLARVAGQGITIAIQNGGGLRASIGDGTITMGNVLEVLPFQNTLATFELTGEYVVAALENGVSQIEEGAGRFAQVGGLTYAFDASAPAGSRVSDVMVMREGAWVPIDPAATYGLVTNDYVRNGGDGYAVFRDHATNAYDFGPDLADVLAEYLAEHNPYQPYTDGRITVK